MSDCVQQADPWSPRHCAVEVERLAPDVVAIRHPAYPYSDEIDPTAALPDQARRIAHCYLKSVAGEFLPPELAEAVLKALNPVAHVPERSAQEGFGWLDIAWGGAGGETDVEVDPRLSSWVARWQNDVVIDRTLLLCAGFRYHGLSQQGEQGLRIVMHVEAPSGAGDGGEDTQNSKLVARITSASISLARVTARADPSAGVASAEKIDPWKIFAEILARFSADALSWTGDSLTRSERPNQRFFFKTSLSPGQPVRNRFYSHVWEFEGGRFNSFSLQERLTNATDEGGCPEPACVFLRDPVSCEAVEGALGRRPFSSENLLNRYRRRDPRLNLKQKVLQHPGSASPRLFEVPHGETAANSSLSHRDHPGSP